MYEKSALNNGLKVITHFMPKACSSSLGIWIKTGGRYESAENKGIAHFLEHLLFKGTKKYSCRQIKEEIEGKGGHLNGFTSEELTCYLVKLPSQYLNLALEILADMVLNPLLKDQDIEKERSVILEEIKMYKDQPQSYVYELLDALLWPNQALGEPVIGTFDSVNKIKREDLLKFKENYYQPQNMIISACGYLKHKDLIKKIKKIFPSLRRQSINKFLPAQEKQTKPQLKIFPKDTEQTHLALGFHGFSRIHPLRFALGLLHVILGANMSSRLFNEVREKKGLAYEIGTGLKYFQDTGAFIVHAGIDNQKINAAVDLILKELKKIKKELISQDEFRRAKEFYLGQLLLSLEDTLDHMLWIGESTATLDRVYSYKDILKEINRLSRQDIKNVAQYLFKEEKLNLALIGPLEDKSEEIFSQLKLN